MLLRLHKACLLMTNAYLWKELGSISSKSKGSRLTIHGVSGKDDTEYDFRSVGTRIDKFDNF